MRILRYSDYACWHLIAAALLLLYSAVIFVTGHLGLLIPLLLTYASFTAILFYAGCDYQARMRLNIMLAVFLDRHWQIVLTSFITLAVITRALSHRS